MKMLYFVLLHFLYPLVSLCLPLRSHAPCWLNPSSTFYIFTYLHVFTYLNLDSTCERLHILFLSLAYFCLTWRSPVFPFTFVKRLFWMNISKILESRAILHHDLVSQPEWFQLFPRMETWRVVLTQIISHIVIDVVFLPHQNQFCL